MPDGPPFLGRAALLAALGSIALGAGVVALALALTGWALGRHR